MARSDIVQRLTLEGAEEIRSKLQGLGQEGEAAAQKLEEIGKVSTSGTTQLATTVSTLRGELNNAGQATGILRDGLAQIGVSGGAATFAINTLSGVFTALGGAALVTVGAIGAVAAAALLAGPALLRMGREAGEAVELISKTARDVGTSAERLNAYARGASAAGVESTKLASGLRTIDRAFGKSLLDAESKTEKVTTGFKRISIEAERTGQTIENTGGRTRTTYEGLGVTVTKLGEAQKGAGKEADGLVAKIREIIGPVGAATDRIEIFNKLVERIGALPDNAKRRALIDSLGIDGLAEAVEASGKTIKEQTDRLNENFRTLGPEQQKAAEEGESATKRLSAAWTAFKQDFGISFTPVNTGIDNFIAGAIESFGRLNKQFSEGGIGAGLTESFKLYASQLGFVFVDPTLRAFNLVKTGAELVAPGIGATFSDVWKAIVDGGGQVWARIPEVFSAEKFSQIWADIETGASTAWEALRSGAVSAYGSVVATATSAGQTLSTWGSEAWATFQAAASSAGQNVQSGFSTLVGALRSLWEGFTSFVSSAFSSLSSFVDSLVSRISSAISSIASSVSSLFSSSSSGSSGDGSTMEGFASGGHVRGRGTETSDSILARLSHNEFVVRAAAVRKYGVGLLSAINTLRLPRSALAGFAAGGMVSAPAMAGGLPAFANGGLADAFAFSPTISTSVEAPAQKALAPVTLQIGGETIGGLFAGEDSLGKLARLASRKQMVSTGRKAGWHGA